ncbi:MAG: hypothetical protein SFZ03_10465 [Candidatus Melainabacteria bacterium]|nr:hypothetical protein [Candidatus Melainabacteria bacterium]
MTMQVGFFGLPLRPQASFESETKRCVSGHSPSTHFAKASMDRFGRDYQLTPSEPITHDRFVEELLGKPVLRAVLQQLLLQRDNQLDAEERQQYGPLQPDRLKKGAPAAEEEVEKSILLIDLGPQYGMHCLFSPTAETYLNALGQFEENPFLANELRHRTLESDTGEGSLDEATLSLESRVWAYEQLLADDSIVPAVNSFKVSVPTAILGWGDATA